MAGRNGSRGVLVVLALLGATLAPAPCQAFCGTREPVVLGDFNDDGRTDLVLGSPLAYTPDLQAGLVHVLYGDDVAGYHFSTEQIWHLDSPGVFGDPYASDGRFGTALAVGDFDCNGVDDLAIGELNAVTVLYGSSPDGLTTTGMTRLTQDFGYGLALATGNFGNHEGCGDDLAVGLPDAYGGLVYVYYGVEGTGTVLHSQEVLSQSLPGVPGEHELGDEFGASLVAGNFDDDPYDDLAVGAPGEDVGWGNGDEGAVNVFYGGGDGFVLPRSQIWHQDSDWVNGSAQGHDSFGESLGVGDVDGDGDDDLIVGVPGEDDENSPWISSDHIFSPGALQVIHGSPTGLQTTQQEPARIWWQDSDGIKGTNEEWDWFATAVVGGDFDDDGYYDVAAGVPGEDRNGITADGGVVNVIYGTSDGLDPGGDQLIYQKTSGQWVEGALQVEGYHQDDDRFGCSLAAGRINDDDYDDLVVTVQDGSHIAVNVIPGGPFGLHSGGDTLWICEGLEGCYPYREFLNYPSAHAPVTDGIYTPGTGEWSDVLPMTFSIGPDGPIVTDPADTTTVDSVFLATLGPEPDPEEAHLNLKMDLVQRTDTAVFWQDPVAAIRFPAKFPGIPEPKIIGVHLHGAGPGAPAMPPLAWLDLDGDGYPDDTTGGSEPNVPAALLGIEVSAAFAASPYESTPHLQIEMRVPLSIPAGFPDPDGPLADVPGGPGIYEPAQGFWTVEYRADAPGYEWTLGAVSVVEVQPNGAVRGSMLAADRAVDLLLLDDNGDGNGLVKLAVLGAPGFDAAALVNLKAHNASDPGRSAWPTLATTQDVNGDDLNDRLLEFSSTTLLTSGVLNEYQTNLLVTAEGPTETVAGTLSGLSLPQAGFVPDGGFQTGGTPLTIMKKNNPAKLHLFWGDSCSATDTDYAIYEGTIGQPGSHVPLVCSTTGATDTVVFTGEGDRYYLVVPMNPDGASGSYGATSTGSQRPPSETQDAPVACMAQLIADSCGP